MLHTIAFETLMRVSKNLKALQRFRINSVFDQCPKISIAVKSEHYEISTVTQSKELLKLLKLRNILENRSQDMRLSFPSFTFTDTHDSGSEHIMIRDLKTKTIIGGFRLLSSGYGQPFFCENKFNINGLKHNSGKILELSKLFLFPEHKNKDLMVLATRFLSEYTMKSHDEYIVSIQSINSDSSKSAALAFRYFCSLGRLNGTLCSPPTVDYLVPNFQHWNSHFKNVLSENEMRESLSLLSSTFKQTIDMGAFIGGPPAIDRQTNRIDFLTILHKEDLNRALWKKSPFCTESHFEYSYF